MGVFAQEMTSGGTTTIFESGLPLAVAILLYVCWEVVLCLKNGKWK